ncbi:MAG: TIGR02757 family protein [Spirochaetota bacterium]
MSRPIAGQSPRGVNRFRFFCLDAYRRYHRPSYIDPDPLAIVRRFESLADREVVGFLASALALGRVGGIVGAVDDVLARLHSIDGRSPTGTLLENNPEAITGSLAGFCYRFFDQRQMAALLVALKRLLQEYGSLESVFADGVVGVRAPESVVRGSIVMQGLSHLVSAIRRAADGALDRSILVAQPSKGSACKRLLLFLRWMVRADEIDPGGWCVVAPSQLLVPLDTHMISIGRAFGILRSASGSLRASARLTEALAYVDPDDPVRFDFSLARLGIHPDIDKAEQIACGDFADTGDFATL